MFDYLRKSFQLLTITQKILLLSVLPIALMASLNFFSLWHVSSIVQTALNNAQTQQSISENINYHGSEVKDRLNEINNRLHGVIRLHQLVVLGQDIEQIGVVRYERNATEAALKPFFEAVSNLHKSIKDSKLFDEATVVNKEFMQLNMKRLNFLMRSSNDMPRYFFMFKSSNENTLELVSAKKMSLAVGNMTYEELPRLEAMTSLLQKMTQVENDLLNDITYLYRQNNQTTRIASEQQITDTYTFHTFYLILIAIFLLGLSVLYAIFGLTKPLTAVVGAITKMKKGHTNVFLPSTGEDELSQIAKAFNSMVTEIVVRDEALRKSQGELEQSNIILEQQVKTRTLTLEDEIKERKKAEDDLKISNERLFHLMKTACDSFWEIDKDGRIKPNPNGFEGPINASPFINGKTFPEMASSRELSENPEKWQKFRINLAEHKIINNFAFWMVNDQGEDICLYVNGIPLFDEETNFIGYRGASTDITALRNTVSALKKARDKAEQSSNAKSEFLSRMSHELRTPMNAILGFSQLMKNDKSGTLTEKHHKFVNNIMSSGKHLLELINQVLELAKIESGTLELSIEDVDISHAFEECWDLMSPMAEKHQITLEFIQPKEKLFIHCDYTRLKQVLFNLCSNGIKYNNPQGLVNIQAKRLDDKLIRITIKDNGIGISKKQRSDIFVPFKRLGIERENISGTGIGMSISKSLVEGMAGNISFISTLGIGSEFYIDLPASQEKSIPSKIKRPPAPVKIEKKQPLKSRHLILYVEDNPFNMALMEDIIDSAGNLKLLMAKSAETGIEIAKKQTPDLILMDINLPDLNGYEALKILRGDSKTKKIPVIAISANATRRDINKGLAAGFDSYITKPFDINQLIREIRYAVGPDVGLTKTAKNHSSQ